MKKIVIFLLAVCCLASCSKTYQGATFSATQSWGNVKYTFCDDNVLKVEVEGTWLGDEKYILTYEPWTFDGTTDLMEAGWTTFIIQGVEVHENGKFVYVKPSVFIDQYDEIGGKDMFMDLLYDEENDAIIRMNYGGISDFWENNGRRGILGEHKFTMREYLDHVEHTVCRRVK